MARSPCARSRAFGRGSPPARSSRHASPSNGIILPMKRSDRRLLTTHVGSLPRPPALRDLLVRHDRGESVDLDALTREAEAAVRHVVARQLHAGIDVINDGEQPRVGFSTYPAKRMRGFGGHSKRPLSRDLLEHPDYAA